MENYQSINDIKLDFSEMKEEGLTIRCGNKLVKLQVSEENVVIDDEKEVREEFEERYGKEFNRIMDGVKSFVKNVKEECEKKEKELDTKLKNAYVMPEVNIMDAKNGISVVKGNDGQLIWLVRGMYSIKTVDGVPVDPKITRRTTTDVVFMVVTSGNKMLKISTCKPISLDYFKHYHQSRPDCWGNWWNNRTAENNIWEIPDDIIKLAREAECVLENVNTDSLVDRNPTGLPRLSTLRKYILQQRSRLRRR